MFVVLVVQRLVFTKSCGFRWCWMDNVCRNGNVAAVLNEFHLL
jgi:hypothetical protein